MATVEVIPGTCQGHASCIAAADDIFDIDDRGTVVLMQREVGPGDRARVEAAVSACPVRALRLLD